MASVQTTRRSFLRQAAGGMGTLAAGWASRLAGEERATTGPATAPVWDGVLRRPLNLAFIGVGVQGRALLFDNCIKMDGVRVQAVCDIWPYRRRCAEKLCREYKHDTRSYEDFARMIEKEKGLDAVIIATPDWMHAEQTIACLEAGLHVYCETPMACSVESARQMVHAARRSKRLLQIGNHLRSRPRYRIARRMIRDWGGIGEFVFAGAHYRRPGRLWPKPANNAQSPDADAARRYGYGSVERLVQWQRYRTFSAGPLARQGSLQVDVLNWLLADKPHSMTVTAAPGPADEWEWPDTMAVVYEWSVVQRERRRAVQGTYQMTHHSGFGACSEYLGGTEGGVQLSSIPSQNYIRRDVDAEPASWEKGLTRLPIELGPSDSLDMVNRYYSFSVKPQDEFPLYWDHLDNFLLASDPTAGCG